MFKNSYNVLKVVAREGEREIVESSSEEYVDFVENGITPDFDNPHVLGVKFVFDEEETNWYINPIHLNNKFDKKEMDSEMLPELLILKPKKFDVYEAYKKFILLKKYPDINDVEKYEEFLDFIGG